ncbi:MAG: metal-dependent hydrolase [Planctomycetota bacterium]
MSVEITWFGHATWMITAGEHKILIDPFLNDNPVASVKAKDVSADVILISHGHFDHIADAEAIAKATGATVVAIYEIAQWLAAKGVENTIGMNIGGSVSQPFGSVKMTPAIHSSGLPDGSYGGEAAGLLLTIGDRKLYFACDTALFSDMALIGAAGLDVAVVPIGDLFTMGPEDSIEAIKLLNPVTVLPTHFNTFPPIEQDPEKWAADVQSQTGATPVVLKPGDSHQIG